MQLLLDWGGVSDPNLELLDQLLTTIPEKTPLLIGADGFDGLQWISGGNTFQSKPFLRRIRVKWLFFLAKRLLKSSLTAGKLQKILP